MKILITGASGMVGKNLTEDPRFQKFDLLTPKRSELNLFHSESVLNYLNDKKPDFIIHCAGRVGGIQANMLHPVEFLTENLDINKNVIHSAYLAGIKNLINLGSSCMYPRLAKNPLSEDLILKGELEPTNEGYAIAKITAQRLCSYIMKQNSKFKYKTLIPCNLYGRHDKFNPEHSHLVPAVIRKLHLAKMNQEKTVEIWGDGMARREFMYSADVTDCLHKSVTEFSTMPDLMNCGLGFDYSVNDYYKTAATIIGFEGEFIHDLTKPVGMKQKLISTEIAQSWGWQIQTTLIDGLSKTYQFFLENEAKG